MTAAARYDIKVVRHPDRIDHVEVVDIEDGEVVLFWDCMPREASRMARVLRQDLGRLDADEFVAHWSAARPEDFA